MTLLGGAAAWPLAVRAQQPAGTRQIGVLMNFAADDPESQARNAALLQGLSELGWTVGRNLRIDYYWGGGDADRVRAGAVQLVGKAPDVIVAGGITALGALQKNTRTVPIVFAGVTDPVGGGFVESLPRPGGNATGFDAVDRGGIDPRRRARCRRNRARHCSVRAWFG
jgi:putative ABC transport system substrate-binding protein